MTWMPRRDGATRQCYLISLFSPSFSLLSNDGRGGDVRFVGAGAKMPPRRRGGLEQEAISGG
jgi:hypothetical protein